MARRELDTASFAVARTGVRMRVLGACSLGGAGHFQPLVPVLDAARALGCETRVIATSGLAPLVARSGHPFTAGEQPAESEISPIREALPVVPAEEASVLGNRELFGRLATTAMLPSMRHLFDDWLPDLVLREPCEYASAVVAAERGVPTAQVAIALAGVEWGSIEVAAEAIEAHRAGLVADLLASPYLTRFPQSLDPSEFADTRRFRIDEGRPGTPLPDWWDGSRAPLTYVTLGSVLGRMTFAEAAFRTVIDAVDDLGTRVLVTTGSFDPLALAPLPDNVHVERWVDQDDVLAEADLVVCHGGSGTTLGALAAGVPMVVLPQFGDQFANARWVATSGVGAVVASDQAPFTGRRPIESRDAPRITEAVEEVGRSPSYRDAARRTARELASQPSVDSLLRDLVTR